MYRGQCGATTAWLKNRPESMSLGGRDSARRRRRRPSVPAGCAGNRSPAVGAEASGKCASPRPRARARRRASSLSCSRCAPPRPFIGRDRGRIGDIERRQRRLGRNRHQPIAFLGGQPAQAFALGAQHDADAALEIERRRSARRRARRGRRARSPPPSVARARARGSRRAPAARSPARPTRPWPARRCRPAHGAR